MSRNEHIHQGMAEDRHFDAIIVGASIAGLTSAAILAHRGFKVAVVETLEEAGGKIGATRYRGHWINLGHRDAESGIADVGQPVAYRKLAEKEAGIDIPVRKGAVGNDTVLIHDFSTRATTRLDMNEMIGSAESEGLTRLLTLIKSFVPEAQDPEGAARGLAEALSQLASIPEEVAWQLITTHVGDWVHRNVAHPEARQALINQMESACTMPGEEASLGRLILSTAWHYSGADWIEDDEVAGMQTMIEPWVRAIEANGGEMWLGWKPIEIIIERERATAGAGGKRGRVAGVVALNTSNLVQVLKAPIVVTDHYGWNLPNLIDRRLLPEDFLTRAEDTRKFQTEGIGWIGSFTRLPRLRETGEQESFSGFQRIIFGEGLPRFYHSTFHWTSLTDPDMAPDGRHQMAIWGLHPARFSEWMDAKAGVDTSLEFVRNYYSDFDACLEWGRYQWTQAPQYFGWHLMPVLRHPVTVSTLVGLYCASSTAEGMAGWVDIEHQVAIEAANQIEIDFGRPDGSHDISARPASNAERASASAGAH